MYECMICEHWFFNHGFKFQDYLCNGCHDLTMLSVDKSNVGIITVKNYIAHSISKYEAINLLKILFLKIVGIYIKNIVLISSL